jgi:hypothetical protein
MLVASWTWQAKELTASSWPSAAEKSYCYPLLSCVVHC